MQKERKERLFLPSEASHDRIMLMLKWIGGGANAASCSG